MPEFAAIVLALLLFAGMMVLLDLGFRLARRYKPARGEEATSLFDTAIFALLGLLLAFAFSGAMERLNVRRELIVEEVNALSTMHLRNDLLAQAQQKDMRPLFKNYVDARLDYYRAVDAGGDGAQAYAKLEQLQVALWRVAVAGVSDPSTQFSAEVVLPAVNDVIDITTTRRVALGTHMSYLVLTLLCGLSLLSAFMAGAGMARHGDRHVVHGAIYAATVALTIYTILDLDNPRGGLIRNDVAEQLMIDLSQSL